MAIASEQIGIGIRRFFTRPGTHPYDTVEWERRDARIPNHKDGGDAFYQPDVEFPTSWSQNATNIVAQKYFRGTLGTPERETSLKQVIDRIADTITAWGVCDGYFVDDEEGAAFRDELKYILLTQRGAFNSPVWFNIGVKGVPQQSSACQPYHAPVNTPAGAVPIGRLVESGAVGTKVLDAHGLTKIVAVKANGRKHVFRVHTKAGLVLDVTTDHLVWRRRRGFGEGFVEAGTLQPGDLLEWHQGERLGASYALTGAVADCEIAHVEHLGETDVFDIQTESGEYLSNNLRVHNCFILAVDDTMDGILNWYREEGIIFKGGSGSGINLSTIRSSYEKLKGGGTASGPVSFMRGADASAGTIKSGGKTRRAAKMVILNADHPDIEEFIWCKAIEERKARALRDAGFDMDLDGRDSHSIQYQNANNSVRVTDDFMQAVLDDRDWDLKAVTTGETIKAVKARDLMRQIAEAAWECADPGMQFDTTINRWHTAPNTGRINGSNPCFPGSERVHTDKGMLRFAELADRVRAGETFGIYTHDATSPDAPAERLEITRPEAVMLTGWNEIVRLRFSNGMELRCTPRHKIFTTNRGYVEARDLTPEDRVKVLDLPAPAISADARIAVSSRLFAIAGRGSEKSRACNLPEKWTPEFAHYVGWLVGDGCISGDAVTTVYGTREEQEAILPKHRDLAAWMNGGVESKPSIQANGTVHLRQTRRVIARFFEAIGVSRERSTGKVVPEAVYQAPPDCVAAFLRGLFDADGRVHDGPEGRYVGLGSVSRDLVLGVQQLLTTFGISSSVHETRRPREVFSHVSRDGRERTYPGSQLFDLRISGRSVLRFAEAIGFDVATKAGKLRRVVSQHSFYATDATVRLVERVDDGVELTFNLSEPRNHSYIVNGTVVRNCSEYMHIDNSACNLASINLLKYLDDGDNFDVEAFKHTVEVIFTAQEILVGNADYPTEKIAENSRKFRQLGLGYANLGAMLMALGLPYDSDEGRAWASAVTALMTGHAYATSARTAARMGPFAGFSDNAEPMVNVLRMHRAEVAKVDEDLLPPELLGAAQQAWDEAVELGERFGVRNSQASVLAPTGTIGLALDCDTTGIEPDLALTKAKKLVGGGTMFIVNQTIPRALRRLGYSDEQVDAIVAYIDEHKTIIGAPGFNPEHLPVFACSMGDNAIHYMGHVKMLGAVQPFLSGAVSKTCNVPEDTTVEQIEQLHIDAWKLGIKAIAIYRDNCKVAQPLATQRKASAETPTEVVERIVEHVIVQEPVRQKLPRTRNSKTFSFRVADCRGFATVAEYEDGRPGELFLNVSKQGSTLAGIMDSFAIAVSHGLQYGVPLRAFVETFTNRRFEPAGMTDDPDIRIATSLVDYIFRKLAVEYLSYEERAEIGVLTTGERMQPTLPGVEEAAIANEPLREKLPLADQRPGAGTPPSQPAMDKHDVVLCHVCGDIMQRAGSCYACPSCGSTSGCS